MANGDPARSGMALAKTPAAIAVVPGTRKADGYPLVPLTRKEADGLTDAKAGERIVWIGRQCTGIMHTFTAFVEAFRPEIESMRARYRQQGRRKPIPGCPTWEEVLRRHFHVSYSHMARLLAPPKERKPRGAAKTAGPAVVDVAARRVPTVESLADDWREVISGCDLIQEQTMADLFARVGVDPHWVIKAALRNDPHMGLAAVEVIAELWRLGFSLVGEDARLDDAGRLRVLVSLLQNVWYNDWLLLARALEEVQPQVGEWEGTRGWTPEHLGLWGKDRATAIGRLLGKVDKVLKLWKVEAEKDPGHASDLLGRKWEGFMGQWRYDGMKETDRKKLEAYVEFRSRAILDRATALLKKRGGR